jgi:hypothetical protein
MCPLWLPILTNTGICQQILLKMSPITNFMKTRSAVLHADKRRAGETEMAKLKGVLLQLLFTKTPKNGFIPLQTACLGRSDRTVQLEA